MGLDNGIILHTHEPVPELRVLKVPEEYYGDDFEYHYDLCYWRKCWNIRRAIAAAIEADYEYASKCWLSIPEIKNIWWALDELNNRVSWDEDGGSIWTYDEIQYNLERSLQNLEWLIQFMRTHDPNDYMVEFYDSY